MSNYWYLFLIFFVNFKCEGHENNHKPDPDNKDTNQTPQNQKQNSKSNTNKKKKDNNNFDLDLGLMDHFEEAQQQIRKQSYDEIMNVIYNSVNSKAFVFKDYVDGGNFQKGSFVCLLNIIYKNTQDLAYLQMDTYLEDIKKIVTGNNESDFNISQIFNIRIIDAINTLFINFQNLSSAIRKKITNECRINVAETKLRCEDIYKKPCHNDLDVESQNPFSFSVKCKDLVPQKTNLKYIRSYGTKCYHECPLFYSEMYNKCAMPMAYENKIYSSLADCESDKKKTIDPHLQQLAEEHYINISCKGYLNGTFYVPNCLPGFQKQLYLFCVPDCPNGMIPSEKYCLKRNPIDVPNYIVFNFTDLFLSPKGEEKKFIEDKQIKKRYRIANK